MRRIWLTFVALALLVGISACSTANVGSTPTPDDSARGTSFVASVEEGLGTFEPSVSIEEQGNTTIATIYAGQVTDLEAAYVNLSYDSSVYTPESVEFGELLGDSDSVLNLALTDITNKVPIGSAQMAGKASPVNTDGVLATVYFSNEPFANARSVASAPNNSVNAVDDLKIIDQQPGSISLSWTEKNIGDYDNNGEVSISDLTPIALLIGQVVATATDPVWAALVDGDGNGEINAADITPIGLNFGNVVKGYAVYADDAGTNLIDETDNCTCDREAFFVDKKSPVLYSYIAASEETTFTVRPVDGEHMGSEGVLSNVAIIINEPGAPAAPTDLAANSDDEIGHQTVNLTWTASTSGDVGGYEVYRKLAADADTEYVMIQQVGGKATSYTDYDETFVEAAYDYRVRAVDFTDLKSDYSNVASVTPYFLPLPSAPQNLQATNEISTGLAIELNWEAPADSSALRFFIFSKGPGESEFSQVGGTPNPSTTTFTHTNLQDGQTYEYYVTSVGIGSLQSEPSNTVSMTPSEQAAIQITSLTTDKTTHFANGGDTSASNITVETSVPADSVDWSVSPSGSVTGTGNSMTYKPAASTAPGLVTITCTVHKGSGQDSRDIEMYLTEASLKTQYGNSGKFIDFGPVDTLMPLSQGGNIQQLKFSDLADGEHAVLFNFWEIWCGPCRAELPDMSDWATDYSSFGFRYVGNSEDYTQSDVKKFYQGEAIGAYTAISPPYNDFYNMTPVQSVWNSYGFTGGIPTSILFDKDGNARLQQVGSITGGTAVTWERVITQLVGAPAP